jgi:hypothetical protein
MTEKWRDLTDFPNLNQFFEAYFDEVWVEIYRDQEEVIDDFLSQAGPEIEAIANETALLLASATDDELCDTLRWHGVLFLLQHEGVAARTWLSAFRDRLREAQMSAASQVRLQQE